ncbi:hypothetical protein BC830DRAFT_1101870 [Chytriomyces sp. MP71]|nr:hypothetical protein BC830DRAFT_1101870 [Chytriomyces sp. MP71]
MMLASFTGPLLRKHAQAVTLGYSQRQLFDLIADVGKYPLFVPWCAAASVLESTTAFDERLRCNVTRMRAELGVGFQSFNEKYTSTVTCLHFHSVNAVASNSSLFKTLTTTWTLTPAKNIIPLSRPNYKSSRSPLLHSPRPTPPSSVASSAASADIPHSRHAPQQGPPFEPEPSLSNQLPRSNHVTPTRRLRTKFTSSDLLKTITPTTANSSKLTRRQRSVVAPPPQIALDADHPICNVQFHIEFEFHSVLYAQVSDLFFEQVSLAMVESFEKRAKDVYGDPCPFLRQE